MKKKYKIAIFVLLFLGAIALLGVYLRGVNVQILNPAGTIGQKERHLIIFAAALSSVVVIPVFTLLFVILWRYRAGNKNATYLPDWDRNALFESIWWLVPTGLIVILSVITWNSSHQLDPYRAISSNVKPLHVQVVALDWKWLFIYPDQNIATVNYLEVPVNTPVSFQITSDAPMNSFWIPQLGGQIYAMPGMSTQLQLMASKVGSYNGSSANISGVGFAGMKFKTRAVNEGDFDTWVESARHSPLQLSQTMYDGLAKASQNNAPATYASVQQNLYVTIVMKYMMPMPEPKDMTTNTMQMSAPAMSNMQGMGM
ncbi:MAG: ubiquinol oxidase subunit II [Candidatus Saccharibacteria bacterium]